MIPPTFFRSAAGSAVLSCLAACGEAGPSSSASGAPSASAAAEIAAGVRALAAGRADEAERLLSSAVAEAPDDPQAHFHLGRARFAQSLVTLGAQHVDVERVAAAAASFDEALRLAPDVAAYHIQRGIAALRLNDLPRAESELRRALELDASISQAHAELGLVLAVDGRLEEALASFERAVALDPTLASAQAELGKVALELGSLERALAAFDAALALTPSNPDAWWGRAQALRQLGRADEADAAVVRQKELVEAAAEAEKSEGPSEARLAALPRFREGIAQLRAQHPADARAAFEAALALDPTLAQAHANLGVIAEREGDAARARVQYAAALELNDALELPRIRLAELYAAAGEVDAAAEAAREVLRRNPEHAEARSLLARLGR